MQKKSTDSHSIMNPEGEIINGIVAGSDPGQRSVGIGVDIEGIHRFEQYSNRSHPFLRRVFTSTELEYCFGKEYPYSHLAARFAGKEAVRKAILASSSSFLSYKAIEILNRPNGAPYINLFHDELRGLMVFISLSHSADYAIAFAIVIGVSP